MAESNDIFSRTPTFHDTDAGYILPNDPAEHSRLHDQHLSLVSLTDNLVVHAPVTTPSTVLDIGCGTGIVTRHLGLAQFPHATHIYGIDLSPVPAPPPHTPHPPNVSFIRGDFLKLALTDPRLRPSSADYIYSRMLECGMTDWPTYIATVHRTLKPNGWLELADYIEDVFFADGRPTQPRQDWPWFRAVIAGSKRQGLDVDAGRNHARYMAAAGFVDVQRREYKVPFWKGAEESIPGSTKITEHVVGDKYGFYWHLIPRVLDGMGYTDADVARFQRDMKRDLADEEGKYQLFCITVGRKPGRDESGSSSGQ